MARSSVITALFRSSILVLLLWSTCSNGAVISLEEKYARLEAKITKLEDQYAHFEALIKIKNQQHDILAKEVSQLKLALHLERETSSKFVTSLDINDENNLPAVKSIIPRTCQEAKFADPLLKSGMLWIDPDGQGIGDDPIYVYCDMTSGSTFISHDSESPVDIGYCVGVGCYSKTINYNVTIRQIAALAELSGECHQSIKYDCASAPFELNGVAYSWWNDRNGEAKYFWAGMNTDLHTCQCGIDGNCYESSTKCNCDSTTSAPLVDDGVITDKSVLPIVRLNFGGTQSSSGVHTLGRLECTGQVAINGLPTSCQDLWRIGHTLSGLYSIMGLKTVESVYCDFTKLPGDNGFQKWIGYVDVKSAPTYFYVQKNLNFDTLNTPIPFEISKLNIGNAMNLTSGKFTVPRTGTYYFSFTGLVSFPLVIGSIEVYLGVELLLNGNGVGLGTVDESHTIDRQLTPFTFHSTLNLKSGDQIWLQIKHMTPGAYLYDTANWQSNHFTGWILEEEIVNSL